MKLSMGSPTIVGNGCLGHPERFMCSLYARYSLPYSAKCPVVTDNTNMRTNRYIIIL